MSDSFETDRFVSLLNDVCDGTLADTQLEEWASVLESNPEARKTLIDHLALQTDIRFLGRTQRICNRGLNEVRQKHLAASAPFPLFPTAGGPGAVSGVGYFASGWPVAYLIATVVFAIGLAIGSVMHVSQPAGVVQQVTPLPPSSSAIGRITGMVDCVLNNDECRMMNDELRTRTTDIHHSSFITQHSILRLGDRLALHSGLLEITYNTGAKVILQGPVTYDIDSAAGGYLSIGRLTAKLEKKSEVGGQRSEQANQKSEIINPKSPDLFAIRTPTALVTDLGTEFGVEVDSSGATQSYVFRGSIRVHRLSAGGAGEDRVLYANQSVRIACDGDGGITVSETAEAAHFIRRIPNPAARTFDLVDVAAGGDGFSGQRGGLIDPTNGQWFGAPDRAHLYQAGPHDAAFRGDGRYHRVTGLPFVDGVFIPNGEHGPVQVDSAGHVCNAFPRTTNETGGCVKAGGVLPLFPPLGTQTDIPTTLDNVDYSQPPHGLLFLHANKGVTFNLDAIRNANPHTHIVRFVSTTGNVEPGSSRVDIRVLVDGQVRFARREATYFLGAMPVSISIADRDRFLTLAVTDGGDAIGGDWVIFGDPRLELVPATAGERSPATPHGP